MLCRCFRFWLWAVWLAVGHFGFCGDLFLVSSPPGVYSKPSPGTASFGWNPSPDPRATGYYLAWGLTSTTCTNLIDVGNVTNATLGGFVTNVAYFFDVVAYDAVGDQSPPSNEIAYPSSGPALAVQPLTSGGAAGGVSISFLANGGVTYYVQATQDFQTWETLFTTNSPVTGPLGFEVAANPAYPKRFFRLAQQ